MQEEDEPLSDDSEEREESEEHFNCTRIPLASLSSSDLSVLENPSSSLAAESGYGHSGDTIGELCDKETNTEGVLSASLSALALSTEGSRAPIGLQLKRSHTVNLKGDRSQGYVKRNFVVFLFDPSTFMLGVFVAFISVEREK